MRPPRSFFTRDWCNFVRLRFGFLMMKVPLPTYAALYRSSGDRLRRYRRLCRFLLPHAYPAILTQSLKRTASGARFGSESAAICAISSSFGGAGAICASASRNIVWQNGQAAADYAGARSPPVLPRAPHSPACPSSSPRNICPPPAPQQNDRSRVRGGSIDCRDPLDHRRAARRKSCDNGPGNRDRETPPFVRGRPPGSWYSMPRQKLAVMLDLERRRRPPSSPRRSCARNAGRWTPSCSRFAALICSMLFSASCVNRQIVAQPPRRIARALLFPQHAERHAQMPQHLRPATARSRGPADRTRPCSPARGSIPACRRKWEARSSR